MAGTLLAWGDAVGLTGLTQDTPSSKFVFLLSELISHTSVGHPVSNLLLSFVFHTQVSDAEKAAVPPEVLAAAREVAKETFKKRMAEIQMDPLDVQVLTRKLVFFLQAVHARFR